jgi:alanyl-tRNA synthetase
VLQAVLPHVSGRGGGKDEMAQGGGSDAAGLPAAFEAAEAFIRERAGQ